MAKRINPKPYFIPALGLYLLSHHFENKGARDMMKNEFKIPNQEASIVLPSSENLLYSLKITKNQIPIKAIAKTMFDKLILEKVCPNNLKSTQVMIIRGTVVSKPSIILKIIAAEPSKLLLV